MLDIDPIWLPGHEYESRKAAEQTLIDGWNHILRKGQRGLRSVRAEKSTHGKRN